MKAESKALTKDIVLTTLVLVIICVVAGAILAGVNELTYIDPEVKAMQKISAIYGDAEFKEVALGENAISSDKGSIVKVVEPQNDSGDLIVIASGNGAYKKTIQVFIVINDYEIKSIDKYVCNETPGLGVNAFNDEHKNQYLGSFKDIDGYALKKTDKNGTIDAVTAATKTSTALNNAVNVAISYYKTVYKGGADNE